MVNTPNLPKLVGDLYNLLEPLESEQRQKVIGSALTLLGEKPVVAHTPRAQQPTGSDDDAEAEFGKKANRWVQQNEISISAIEEVFHVDGEKVEIIASDVPGQGKKAKTRNCYLLMGARALLESDEPKFSDAEAVELCKHMGCYDQANHAKTRNALGNIVAGSKSSGFTLPAPGLRAAAELLKSMTSGS